VVERPERGSGCTLSGTETFKETDSGELDRYQKAQHTGSSWKYRRAGRLDVFASVFMLKIKVQGRYRGVWNAIVRNAVVRNAIVDLTYETRSESEAGWM